MHPACANNQVCFFAVVCDDFGKVGVVFAARKVEVGRVLLFVGDKIVVRGWY
jgi:hypothetical protein